MKANVIVKNGEAAQVFRIIELPVPVPLTDEVLVRVAYTSVNPLDCRIRKTVTQVRRTFPVTLGFDLYGEVAAVGADVTDIVPGDSVIASPNPFFPGANAEYVTVKAVMCLKVSDLDPRHGAAVPLAGITAYEALFDKLRIKMNDTVLIHAGAGGVGHLAVQLAKNAGCRVITTAGRPESLRFCRELLKADHVIDYRTEDVGEAVRRLTGGEGAGLILDAVGGDTFRQSLTYLKAGGHLCTILPVGLDEALGYHCLLRGLTISFEFMGLSGPAGWHRVVLEKLVSLMESKKLIPHVSGEYGFDEIHKAHEELEKGHTIGKIVVRINS